MCSRSDESTVRLHDYQGGVGRMINGKKIGMYINDLFHDTDIGNVCDNMKGIGFDAIELDAIWIDRCKTDEELKGLLDAIHSRGLELSEVAGHIDYVLLDNEARYHNIEITKDLIRRCGSSGISTICVFTGPCMWNKNPIRINYDLSLTDAWNMVFEAYDEIVPVAEKEHVNLAVENDWGMLCRDYISARFLIDHYHSPRLGINFDPSHDTAYGNLDTGFIVRQWGREAIKHIHLKDAAGIQDPGSRMLFPLLGEGYVDWNGMFKALDEIGYDGYMSIEFESYNYLKNILDGNMNTAAELSFQLISKLINNCS